MAGRHDMVTYSQSVFEHVSIPQNFRTGTLYSYELQHVSVQENMWNERQQ